MPSQKILAKKQVQVSELTDKLKSSAAGVLVDYKGITVANDTKLRRELRQAGVSYFVVKNTMLERAACNAGYDDLKNYLSGTSAIAISESDPVAAAKVLSKFAEASKGKFVVKAGFVDGGVIDAEKVAELGNLPSRDGLLSMLLSALTGNLRGLAVAINAVAEKNAEPEAPVVEAEAPVVEAEAPVVEAAPAEETAPEAPTAPVE